MARRAREAVTIRAGSPKNIARVLPGRNHRPRPPDQPHTGSDLARVGLPGFDARISSSVLTEEQLLNAEPVDTVDVLIALGLGDAAASQLEALSARAVAAAPEETVAWSMRASVLSGRNRAWEAGPRTLAELKESAKCYRRTAELEPVQKNKEEHLRNATVVNKRVEAMEAMQEAAATLEAAATMAAVAAVAAVAAAALAVAKADEKQQKC